MPSPRRVVLDEMKKILKVKTDQELRSSNSYNNSLMSTIVSQRTGFDKRQVEVIIKEFEDEVGGVYKNEKIEDDKSLEIFQVVFILLIIALIVFVVFVFVNGNSKSDDLNKRESGYNSLSPEGKKYVDDQMKSYDEYCSNNSGC